MNDNTSNKKWLTAEQFVIWDLTKPPVWKMILGKTFPIVKTDNIHNTYIMVPVGKSRNNVVHLRNLDWLVCEKSNPDILYVFDPDFFERMLQRVGKENVEIIN